jgi:hypothetical protein
MVLLLLTYLLKKFGHKLKLKALLQKPQYLMALQPVKVQSGSAATLLLK